MDQILATKIRQYMYSKCGVVVSEKMFLKPFYYVLICTYTILRYLIQVEEKCFLHKVISANFKSTTQFSN